MSIIIATFDIENNSVHLGCDRRAMTYSGELADREYIKLSKINNNLYFAINGNTYNGSKLLNQLQDSSHLPLFELITIVQKFQCEKFIVDGKDLGNCMFCLVGIKDGDPFVYVIDTAAAKWHLVVPKQTNGKPFCLVAAPSDDTASKVRTRFFDNIGQGNYESVVKDCILYANSIDHQIGSNIDYVCLRGKSSITEGYIATTSTLVLGDIAGQHAGMSGQVISEGSVLIWAGSSFVDRATAPFRVTADGHLYTILGMLGNYTIDNKGLKNTENIDAYIIQRKIVSGITEKEGSLGTDIDANGYVGIFRNNSSEGVANNGIKIQVTNGTPGPPLGSNFSGNMAIDSTGDVWFKGGNVVLGDSGEYKGMTTEIQYKGGTGDTRHMTFVNGILVSDADGA